MPDNNTTNIYIKHHGKRDFSASVKLEDGNWLTAKGKQTRSAIKAVEEELEKRGLAIPAWNKVEHNKPEESPAVTVRTPNVRTPSPLDDSGFITPETDKEKWIAAYERAFAVAEVTALPRDNSLEPGTKAGVSKSEQVAALCETVNKVMEACGFRGAFRTVEREATDGKSYTYKWVTLAGLADPTVRVPEAGEGDRRRYTDLNGIVRDGHGEPVPTPEERGATNEVRVSRRERRARNRAEHKRAQEERETKKYKYSATEEQKDRVLKAARACSGYAHSQNQDSATRRMWYKLGHIVVARQINAPIHTKFEKDLLEAGLGDYLNNGADEFVAHALAWYESEKNVVDAPKDEKKPESAKKPATSAKKAGKASKEVTRVVWEAASAMSAFAKSQGHDDKTCTLWYKIGNIVKSAELGVESKFAGKVEAHYLVNAEDHVATALEWIAAEKASKAA